MRITNTMITSQYKRNLNSSLSSLNYYNLRATNYRKFNTAAEDPVGATKAYSARRAYRHNEDYTSNLKTADNMLVTAQSSMLSLNSIIQEADSSDILQAINGTMEASDREIIAAKLRKMQESIISTMNTKYADSYLFGGANTSEPPFTVSDSGRLLYRGIDVTTGEHNGFDGVGANTVFNGASIDFGKENGSQLNGYTLNISQGTGVNTIDNDTKVINLQIDGDITADAIQSALRDTLTGVVSDADKITVSGIPLRFGTSEVVGGQDPIAKGTIFSLDDLAKETNFIDIGLGLSFQEDKLNTQSVFDTSMPGISFLGFGTDANDNPKNLYTLLGAIADGLSEPRLDMDKVQPFINGFKDSYQNLLTRITEFGAKSNFLEYTETRLSDTDLNLTQKMKDIEMVEPSEAIMDFKMQEFSYMAALQMGTKIIQPTFLDYMR